MKWLSHSPTKREMIVVFIMLVSYGVFLQWALQNWLLTMLLLGTTIGLTVFVVKYNFLLWQDEGEEE